VFRAMAAKETNGVEPFPFGFANPLLKVGNLRAIVQDGDAFLVERGREILSRPIDALFQFRVISAHQS
jgi:hypothetical protein